jgi:hypothetical protein
MVIRLNPVSWIGSVNNSHYVFRGLKSLPIRLSPLKEFTKKNSNLLHWKHLP